MEGLSQPYARSIKAGRDARRPQQTSIGIEYHLDGNSGE